MTPNEQGLKLDGKAALDFIIKHPKIDPTKIFLFGRSLGGKSTVEFVWMSHAWSQSYCLQVLSQ